MHNFRLASLNDPKPHDWAKEIAAKLNIKGDSAYVRVSQLKRQAINKLINNVDYSQVIDFL